MSADEWTSARSPGSCFSRPGPAWLGPLQLSAETLWRAATDVESVRRVSAVLEGLEPDDYLEFMLAYYGRAVQRFGSAWAYADLLTVLHAAAVLLRPEQYLEIGVRRGRSMAVVATASPRCALLGFDLWVADYAGMPNPGPEFVRAELGRVGHEGPLQLVSGDSRATVRAALAAEPDRTFDLVTVDGDHSAEGARADLENVMPRLRIGGVLVMDDVAHPQHPELADVWRSVVESTGRFESRTYTDLGYGVAFAVRRG